MSLELANALNKSHNWILESVECGSGKVNDEKLQHFTDLNWGAGGKGTGFGCDPDQHPALKASKGCEDDFQIPDMKTLLHECSQSRLWAGFHFTAAVVEGEKLCAGVGNKAFDHVQKLRNGSTFGQVSYRGGPRPQCLSGEFVTNVNRQPEDEGGLEGTSAAAAANSVVAMMVPLVLAFSVM